MHARLLSLGDDGPDLTCEQRIEFACTINDWAGRNFDHAYRKVETTWSKNSAFLINQNSPTLLREVI
jgi:hypothetical protein